MRFFIFLVLLLFIHCAQPVPPSGGPIDTEPPLLITDESSALIQRNYRGEPIVLTFNEFIKLNNPSQNVIISPPWRYSPQYRIKGKTLYLRPDEKEELMENTTYVINLSQAVVDFTAGNTYAGQTLILSTGNFIDSLKYEALLYDQMTGTPVAGGNLVLYPNLADSTLLRGRPLYLGVSDSSGYATIGYLPQDIFYALAFKDENQDLRVQPGEDAAFRAESVNLPQDELDTFYLSPNLPVFKITGRATTPGKITYAISRPVSGIEFESSTPFAYSTYITADSARIFYKSDTDLELIIRFGDLLDTVLAPAFTPPSVTTGINAGRLRVSPAGKVLITSDAPVIHVDTGRITLKREGHDPIHTIVNIEGENVEISAALTAGSAYQLIMEAGAIETRAGYSESDTFIVQTINSEELSALEVVWQKEIRDSSYHFILEGPDGRSLRRGKIDPGTKSLFFSQLVPGQVSLKVFRDLNDNNMWDSIDILSKKAAEPIFLKTFSLREGWEVREEMNIKR